MISSLISEFMIFYETAEWEATDNVFSWKRMQQGSCEKSSQAVLLAVFFFLNPDTRKGEDADIFKEMTHAMK